MAEHRADPIHEKGAAAGLGMAIQTVYAVIPPLTEDIEIVQCLSVCSKMHVDNSFIFFFA